MSVFGTERRVSDETFEHDSTVSREKREVSERETRTENRRRGDDDDEPERPPITLVRVSLLEEDLGRDLSWREEGKRAGRTASDQLSDALRKKRKKKTNVIWSSDGTVSLESVKKRNYQPEPRDEKAGGLLPTSDELAELTSFLLFAFQVAIVSFELIVRWIELTITEFLAPPPPPTCSD